MPYESLRVRHQELLSAIKLDGTVLWQLDLSPFVEKGTPIVPFPTALSSGETLLFLSDMLLTVNARGNARVFCDIPAHEPGVSPNLMYSGLPLSTSVDGDVSVLKDAVWQKVGEHFGYDIVTPAVYHDNSLAIAGYYGSGFCRVALNGERYWTTPLLQADLLPMVNHAQIAAVGSMNDQLSAFFTSDGRQIGEYHHVAKFAEYVDGGWIAFSKER